MLSMTGYGTAEARRGPWTATVELRSVNHRFLDVSLRLPGALSGLEQEIRQRLKERLGRGRVSVSVQLAGDRDDPATLLPPGAVDQGLRLLTAMADRLESAGQPRPVITLDHLLALPDLFRADPDADTLAQQREAVLEALDGALEQLLAMKRTEGEETAAELRRRLAAVRERLAEVNALVPDALREAQQRLQERLQQLLETPLDPQRLAQEAAILVDRGNINEECERLASHLEQFQSALDSGGQVAKRLNFLLQEMHREVNTMGSKTQNLAITRAVIAMKEEIESMREQVQNLE